MGQAKQRGTFEQRQQQAYDRIDANIEVRKKELEELEAFEKRQLNTMQDYVTNVVVKNMERVRDPVAKALINADYSQLELRVFATLPAEEQQKMIDSLQK
jgi:hypothetical protein